MRHRLELSLAYAGPTHRVDDVVTRVRAGQAQFWHSPDGCIVTEVLDYIPGRFRVIRHVRPKYACRYCDPITQAPGPPLPTPRGRAAPGMLAHLLASKYTDHLPLYRQSQIYARDGLDLDRSTPAFARAGY